MKKNILVLKIIAICVIIVIVFFGYCGKEKTENIKIGFITALTGDYAVYGEKMMNAAKLAAEEINNEGGVRGTRIEFIFEDGMFDAKTSVNAIKKLVFVDKVQVIVGAENSSPSLADVPIADANKVVLYLVGASSPKLSNVSDYVFRNVPSDAIQGVIIARIARKVLHYSRACIIYANNDYGADIQDIFSKEFEKLGGKVLLSQSFNDGDIDFKTQLTKIKTSEPELIFMPAGYKEAVKILITAKEIGLKSQFIAPEIFYGPEILTVAREAAEGVICTAPAKSFEDYESDPLFSSFSTEFEKRFGEKPDQYAANTYDAVKILAKAMETGGTKGPEIAKALRTIKTYEGVAGKMTFENGDAIMPFSAYVVKGNKFIKDPRISEGIQ